MAALALCALAAAGCYCSHRRPEDRPDAARPDAGTLEDAGPPDDAGDDGGDGGPDPLACDESLDALDEAARLEALVPTVGFGADPGFEMEPAEVTAIDGARLELTLDTGGTVTFRWPRAEPAWRFHEHERVIAGVRDGWHYVESDGAFGPFAYVRTFDAASPPSGDVVGPTVDLPIAFSPRCARPVAGCGGDEARQFLLGVGREAFRRWLPPDGRDVSDSFGTEVWHVGSLESPLACGAPSRFRAVVTVTGETICIC